MCIIDNTKQVSLHLNSVLDIHVITIVDCSLCNRYCIASLRNNLCCHSLCSWHKFFLGNYLIYKTDAVCFVCIYIVTGKDHFFCTSHTYQTGKSLCTTESRNDSKTTLWLSEDCIVGITVVITFGLAKPISAYQMGESYARNMGVNVKALRIALILLSSLLSACVTAFAGPISFVGIAVPHLIKLATHTAKPIILIPGCFLGGAVITLFCDGIARTVFAPTEISISSVTAVFLVPVVIAAMLRKQRM